tara:strand:- start:86 stop:910 length:825 start_codon:yes stop_codon:yes gene_type:complete
MTRSNVQLGGQELKLDADGDTSITADTDDTIHFKGGGSDRVTIDTNGHLLVAKSSTGIGTVGAELKASGELLATVSGDACAFLNRTSSDGTIIDLRKDGSTIGSIGINGEFFIAHTSTGIKFVGNNVVPTNSAGATADNDKDIGSESVRFVDIHATNGTIQTSDQNEKQDTASLTSKELNVAKKLSALFKTFRWKDKVAEKGDKARTHTGIIAQEVQSAFNAEGLDASKYGLFISGTYKDEDGKEQTRLGVRYAELFSFIFSSIEARLTALESK